MVNSEHTDPGILGVLRSQELTPQELTAHSRHYEQRMRWLFWSALALLLWLSYATGVAH